MHKKYPKQTDESGQVSEPDYSATYTAKDYLSWSFEGLFEIIKGKAWKMSPAPKASHQRISFDLSYEFGKAFKKSTCQAFHAPFDVYLVKEGQSLEKGTSVVQPDICVVCDSLKIQEKGCVGAPDLVVEIISPSTAKRDMNDKFNLYEEFGVAEYWVVFPYDRAISIYSLQEGAYQLHGLFEQSDTLQSPLFETLSFNLHDIFPPLKQE